MSRISSRPSPRPQNVQPMSRPSMTSPVSTRPSTDSNRFSTGRIPSTTLATTKKPALTRNVAHHTTPLLVTENNRANAHNTARTNLRTAETKDVPELRHMREGLGDKSYDGAYVGVASLAYPGNVPLEAVPPVTPHHNGNGKGTIVYVNGIRVSKAEQFNSMRAIADQTGANVVGIHNSTGGAIRDLSQSALDKFDMGQNKAVKTLANLMVGKARDGKSLHLMGHSQGGLVISRALKQAQQRLLKTGMSQKAVEKAFGNFDIETFGQASTHFVDGPKYNHYVNKDDYVPQWFGLGWDGYDKYAKPVGMRADAGKNAKVHEFDERHWGVSAPHSFRDVYLPRRKQP